MDDEQVARVFRALANEHCAKRASLERDLTWRAIAERAREREQRRAALAWRYAFPAAVAICVVCAVLGLTYRPMLEYEIVGAAMAADGEIRAGLNGASLLFSDGSSIRAKPHSLLSLSIVGQQAVLARLFRGALDVTVRRDENADWRFLAGPYEVRVVGTRFHLTWNSESAELVVKMHEGSARITGPGKFDRTLFAGETLHRTGIELDVAREADPAANARLVSKPPPPRLDLGVERSQPDAGPAKLTSALLEERSTDWEPMDEPKRRPPEDDWPSLVSRGKFAEVVEAAEREGVETALSNHPVADLKALAQAARYTGKNLLALRSWTGIRERFRGNAAASQAAFFLGRLYDELGDPEPARDWLDTYLAEAPNGVYASEALGRRLALARRLGQHADAKRLARQYLEHFPAGAYVRTARSLLAR